MYYIVVQFNMRYEWDPLKEKINVKKHGVSFSDAKDALNCGLVIVLKEDSDFGEERYVYLGMCKKLNVLVVVVAYPEEEITRIISARKANKKERIFYETKL
jgi:uncharacterized DUF497 family protein